MAYVIQELNLMLLTEIPQRVGHVNAQGRELFFQELRIPKVAVDSIVQSKTVSIKILSLWEVVVLFIVLWHRDDCPSPPPVVHTSSRLFHTQ